MRVFIPGRKEGSWFGVEGTLCVYEVLHGPKVRSGKRQSRVIAPGRFYSFSVKWNFYSHVVWFPSPLFTLLFIYLDVA